MKRHGIWSRNRRKLTTSLAIFAMVMVLAVALQSRRSRTNENPTQTPAPRVVFGTYPSAQAPQSRARAAEPRSPEIVQDPPATNSRDVPEDIQKFLDRWRTTLMDGDLRAHAALYAPRVERFFRHTNVSREAVRQEKAGLLRKYPTFRKYSIRDVKVDFAGNKRALVTFRKDWDARGARQFAGSESQRLTLRRNAGSWEIIGEQELRVFWLRK